jgi:hypothetical protein
VVFEHVVAALVHGSGYERIATPGCSDRTIRRRLAEWAEMGIAEAKREILTTQWRVLPLSTLLDLIGRLWTGLHHWLVNMLMLVS